MTATMIKMDGGFFIPHLEGFDDIQKDTIDVNIDLQAEEVDRLSYKELKGIAILERYYEKLKNQIDIDNSLTDIQQAFRKEHHITMSLDEYLSEK
jgi:hypothetical protein